MARNLGLGPMENFSALVGTRQIALSKGILAAMALGDAVSDAQLDSWLREFRRVASLGELRDALKTWTSGY